MKGLLVIALLAAAVAPVFAKPTAIDVAHSKMTVYVYKQGLFSFLADNHEVAAPLLSGSYDSVTNAVELTVDAAKMKVLDAKMAADRRASVQSNMSGPQVLDVAKYPRIVFRSTSIKNRTPSLWNVTGDLTLHGQTHPVAFDVHKVDETHFSGSATIRQTMFGIAPIRIAGGAVRVKDDVKVEFAIALRP